MAEPRRSGGVAAALCALAAFAAPGAGEDLRTEVLAQKGVDARRWGEDVANPFTNLTAGGRKKLKTLGVDADRLAKLNAVLVTGNYCGANSKTLVNRDADTILILGKGFTTHGDVYSIGPVLAVKDATIMGRLTGAGLVWCVENPFPGFKIRGAPLLAGPDSWLPDDERVTRRARRGDYGWRRPADFLKPLTLKPGQRLPPLAVTDADKKRQELRERILAQKGVDTADWCERVMNPFTNLSGAGKAKLAARGIDAARLAKFKAVLLTGNYCGADSKDFVNRDPDTVLIVGKGFSTHGDIFSVGPMLAVEDAHFMGGVTGSDLVWFVDKAFRRGWTEGLPVIMAPSAWHCGMWVAPEDTWHGDYGWQRPADFLKPAPITLTPQELDDLWSRLPSNDPVKVNRIVRTLVVGAKQSLPYLRRRLYVEAAPPDEQLSRLAARLNSDRFKVREAASEELRRLGLHAEPALRKLLEGKPQLEVRRRAELILASVEQERRRVQRALRALVQIGSPEGCQLLAELAKGLPGAFVTREAAAAQKRLAARPEKGLYQK